MSAPFHFPTEYGKLGNWPGSLGPNQAQTLLMQAVSLKQGARIVELGFDGGRTTIVLNWAARDIPESRIHSLPVMQDETGLWFRRAQILHRMDRERVTAHETLEPFAADMIVMNPIVGSASAWIDAAADGAIIVRIGPAVPPDRKMQELVSQPGITIWKKLESSREVERAIKTVVNEFSENKAASLDANQRAKIHSLRRDKKRDGGGNGSNTQVHAPVAADQGTELLPS